MMKRAQIFFWILWVGAVAATAFFGGQIIYQLFYILTLILVLAIIFLLTVRFLIKVNVETETSYGVTGGQIAMVIKLENKFIIPVPAVVVSFIRNARVGCLKKYVLTLNPRAERTLRTKLDLDCRGIYKVGISDWRTCDYFGIFSTGRRVTAYQTIYVLPRILSMSDQVPLPPPEEDTNEASRSGELAGARPYVGTDSMKNIHWKLSAKGESLYTKQFSGTKHPPVWVLFDLSVMNDAEREIIEDKLLETALSLTNYLLEATPVVCAAVSEGIEITKLKSAPEFDEYYKTMGLAEFAGTDFDKTLEALDMEESGIVWLVTTSNDVLDSVTALLSYGWEVRWIHVSRDPDTQKHDKARNFGALVQHISLSGDVTDCAWMVDMY
jgi:uncharacterized protein (DUF58 family)